MGTDDTELFRLFFTHLSVYCGKYLFIGRFHAFGAETGNIGAVMDGDLDLFVRAKLSQDAKERNL